MPTGDGRLTDADVQIIKDYLKGKAKVDPHPCPYCGTSRWIWGGHLVIEEVPTRIIPAGSPQPVVPYVLFFCENCAYTMHFNAALIGIRIGEDVPSPTVRTVEVPGG